MKLVDPTQILTEADAQGLRRVVVVTALGLEMEAVRVHLANLGTIKGRDGNFLELGRFSGTGNDWLVVVVESGAGNLEASGAVTNALVTIGDAELIVFVGVAASRKPKDAGIGSVLAATHLYWPYSGKEAKAFSARPHSIPVKPALVHLARKIARDGDWPTRVHAPAGFAKPGSPDYPALFPPKALTAPIVSVEAVVSNSRVQLEKRITQHYGDATGLEMEGYGAVFAAERESKPLIVIRGISDLREGKEPGQDLIDQPIAAAHASAFAFELIDAYGASNPRQGEVMSITSPPPFPASSPADVKGQEQPEGPLAHVVQADAIPDCNLVLTLKGREADYPTERVESIVAGLKALTGNPDISVIRTKVGSFSLFLRVTEDDVETIKSAETATYLRKEFGVNVISVLREEDYERATEDRRTLEIASRSLLNWPRSLPDGTEISRPELEQILSTIESTDSSTTALLGLPGSGKSALLAALGIELRKRSIPILAIKADLLDPSVDTEDDLKDFLGLSKRPSVMLREIASLRSVVLVIDQLDALATYVDLSTGRLSVLLNLVRRLGGERNIHIVLSARSFEYEHDTRLKTVQAESITLALPPWSTVLKILEEHGVAAAGWPLDAQEVMRTPQALSTFLKLERPASIEPFLKYHEMLDYLWRERILNQPNGPQLSSLASSIAEDMAEKEALWLASARYDAQAPALASLVASGVLAYFGGPGSIGFSHQTVFEHALARAFAQQTGSLSAYVLERESSLFIRPKLWTSLAYLRGVEPDTYLAELRTIWGVATLRKHLRILLIEFLGQQSSPTDSEAVLFAEALKSGHRRTALQAMIGSQGWFERFRSTIAEAMASHSEGNVAAGILDAAWKFAPADVIALIQEYWLPDVNHDSAIWTVIKGCPAWSEDVLRIAEVVASRSTLSPYAFDDMVGVVGVSHPDLAIRLVAKKLYAELDKGIAESERRTSLAEPEGDETTRVLWQMRNSTAEPITSVVESDGWDSLEALAVESPSLFLQHLWPWFTKVFTALRRFLKAMDGPGFAISYLLDLRFEGERDDIELPEKSILGAFRVAMESFAEQDPTGFEKWLSEIETEDAVPAQRLFAHGLASQPQRFATRSLRFFIDNLNRLHLGNSQDMTATAVRLVGAVSPYWSDEELQQFETAVLSYRPRPREGLDAKGRQYFDQLIRKLKLRVLSALPEERTSNAVKRHITEERRRFPDDRTGATFYGPTFIGSTIEAKSLALASDKDIVNAFKQLPDATGWDNPKHWRKGGNIQLAREFAEFSKTNAERAKRLIDQFEPSYGTRAAGYAIDAMAESSDPALVIDLIKDTDARGFEGEEFRGRAAGAIERLIRRDYPVDDATIELVTAWLSSPNIDEPDHDGDEDDDLTKPSDQKISSVQEGEREGSVLWGMGGLSILPHGNFPIIETLIRIFLQRKDPDRIVDLLTSQLKRDEGQRIWSALLRWFAYIRPTDLSKLATLIDTLFKRYPNLSTTREAAMMLTHSLWTVPDLVRAIVADWKAAEAPLVRQAYGELIALAALIRPELDWPKPMLSDIISEGTEDERVGVAYAAVNVWSDRESRSAAASSQILQQLAPIATPKIWHAILDLFRLVDEIEPDENWTPLLSILADNLKGASSRESTFIVDRLQTLLPHQALLVGRIATALVEKWRNDLGDIRTGTSAVAPDFVDIAVTLHRLGPSTRNIGTTLFEELLEVNAYSARATLDQIDNRFRGAASPQSRRLPRRNRRSRRTPRTTSG
ncbi:hypothetical protein HFO32_29710 [Rhizobium leguminosarum]|uniref:phosphorylase family protein n=1 Tax=Rhizobium leguminosarum TaxID=384 RepID=UPI001C97C09E|nr:hypothetical protein [Rhizobium leguminosarum]MBY5672829.1 hypothetical protein [Rhizobium leguminosarum]MBY5686274.1 hypothetical protein [Rhizobium leguminosarum]